HRVLHSFPTRRSSDLVQPPQSVPHTTNLRIVAGDFHERVEHAAGRRYLIELGVAEYLAATSYTIGSINRHKGCQAIACISSQDRSEEHTSELQSRGHL